MRYWIALAAVLSLAGCKTMQEAQMDADDAKCRSYGAEKGSPPYMQCRMNLDAGRASVRAAEAGRPLQ